MKGMCVICGRKPREYPNEFCHGCISVRAEQIHARTGSQEDVPNWYRAIEELKYEVHNAR